MEENYPKLCALLYAIAAMIAAFDPVRAELLLGLVGGLLALPVLLIKILSKVAGAQLVLFIVLVIGLMIPVLQFMVAIVGLLLLLVRLQAIARAMPIVILGLCLHLGLRYGILYVSDHILGEPQGWVLWLLAPIYGMLAWSLFNWVVAMAITWGRDENFVSAVLLGWPIYGILITLTFIIPGPIGDLSDG